MNCPYHRFQTEETVIIWRDRSISIEKIAYTMSNVTPIPIPEDRELAPFVSIFRPHSQRLVVNSPIDAVVDFPVAGDRDVRPFFGFLLSWGN